MSMIEGKNPCDVCEAKDKKGEESVMELLTLDEHIKKAEEDAAQAEADSDWGLGKYFLDPTEAQEYAENCRQLAKWLKDYKRLLERESCEDAISRKGKWIRVDRNKVKCSECEITHLIAQYPHGAIDFCPNCGAKMVETQESEGCNECEKCIVRYDVNGGKYFICLKSGEAVAYWNQACKDFKERGG